MKTLTVRLPEPLIADIDAESRERKVSKSDVVRERLQARRKQQLHRSSAFDAIDGLPCDLSARKKDYLKTRGYGQKRPR